MRPISYSLDRLVDESADEVIDSLTDWVKLALEARGVSYRDIDGLAEEIVDAGWAAMWDLIVKEVAL